MSGLNDNVDGAGIMSESIQEFKGMERIQAETLDLGPDKTITLYISAPDKHTIGLWEDQEEFLGDLDTEEKEKVQEKESVSLDSDEIKIKEVLGEGGMGIVYLAQQQIPKRNVAVKRLKEPNNALGRALLQEAMTTGSLEHPNIIPIHSVNLKGPNAPEVVMKRVHGKTLCAMLKGRALEQEELRDMLNVLLQVCRALEFSHSRGILHRDIKPENIMIGSFGEVYVLDWGLAVNMNEIKKSPRGLVGTPAYMAPEMVSGDPLDLNQRTDVYLLGATMHEFLTGKRRHPAKNITEALKQAEASKPYNYPENVLNELGTLTNRCCSKDMQDRPNSILNFRENLEEILKHWEALRICHAAENKLQELKTAVKNTSFSSELNIEAHQLFSQARFGFEQSLSIYPDCQQAQIGLREALEFMSRWSMKNNQLEFAGTLLQALEDPSGVLTAELKNRKSELLKDSKRAERAKEIAANYDPNHSRAERKRLAIWMLATIICLVAAVIVYDTLYKPEITPQRLLITTGTLALMILTAIFIGRKNLFSNAVGTRIATALGTGAVGMIMMAVIGFVFKSSGDLIMMADIVIVGLTFANAYPSIGVGIEIAIFCMILALICLFNPALAHMCFLISGVVSTVATVYDWHKENKDQDLTVA